MFSPARLALLAAVVLAFLSLGCNNRSRGGRLPDTGTITTDSGTTPDAGLRDSSAPDTSRPMDSGAFDSSRPDTGFPMDSGRRDTSAPPDSSRPDTTTPPVDSGLPLGDAGICIVGMASCPAGQMCCELLPGTGFGMCAVTCT